MVLAHLVARARSQQQVKTVMPFHDALAVARSLEFGHVDEWAAWCGREARPANMPTRPDRAYVHDGWQGWRYWLGTGGPDAVAQPAAIMCHEHPRGTAGLAHERIWASPSAMAAAFGVGPNASQLPTLAQTLCSRRGAGTASTVRHACPNTIASPGSAPPICTYVFLLGQAYSGTSASPLVCDTHGTHAAAVRAPRGVVSH